MIKFALLVVTSFDVARMSMWLIGHMASSHRLSKTQVHHYSGDEAQDSLIPEYLSDRLDNHHG